MNHPGDQNRNIVGVRSSWAVVPLFTAEVKNTFSGHSITLALSAVKVFCHLLLAWTVHAVKCFFSAFEVKSLLTFT